MQAVVLSGGIGSRLWPVSNEAYPKPFIVLEDGQSLLQKVFLRAANISSVTNIITVANRNFLSEIEREYNKIESFITKPLTLNFILEPFGKGTTAAIAAAALQIEEYYGANEMILILPADHLIEDEENFKKAIIKAEILAQKGSLVVFGIKPDGPETGYGYIKYNGNKVEKFIEKPNAKLAQEYFEEGEFLWNSGIFCFTAESILRELSQHCPITLGNVHCALNLSKRIDDKSIELNPIAFSEILEDSIDYSVMEKSNKIAVVPCDIGWKDIGSWESLSKLTPVDSNGNRVKGNAVLHNVSNCYIENNGQLIGVVGVKNLAIISTKNGLLITETKDSNAVRSIYSQIQDSINTIQKFFWGVIEVIQDNHKIKINQITINPKTTIEPAKYCQYSANWIVTNGKAEFIKNNQHYIRSINESHYIAKDSTEHIANKSEEPLVIITIQ